MSPRSQGDNRTGKRETPQPCPTVNEGDEQNKPSDGSWVQPRAQIIRHVHSDAAGPEEKPGS